MEEDTAVESRPERRPGISKSDKASTVIAGAEPGDGTEGVKHVHSSPWRLGAGRYLWAILSDGQHG